MVKNLNLICNSTASPSAHPSIYPFIHLVPKSLGAESSRGIDRYGTETGMVPISRAESSRCRNEKGENRQVSVEGATCLTMINWAASSEFVSSSIPS